MRKILFTTMVLLLGSFSIQAQSILVENLKGAKVNFAEIIKGDMPVIISFWATWCKPCIMEMEALKEIKEEWHGKVRIVSISIDDARSSGKVQSFVKGHAFPFEIYKDGNQALYKHLNCVGVPSVFIYKNGKQVYMHSGYSPGDEENLLEEAFKHL